MVRQVSVFSIARERAARSGHVLVEPGSANDRHREVMEMLAQIQSRIAADGAIAAETEQPAAVPEKFLEDYKSGMDQVAALKGELIEIEAAIERTKVELAGLHQSGAATDRFNGVTDELDEVVKGTERATDAILHSTEEIENNARNLAASLNRDGDRNMAYEIQEHATKIFEACNFQDLTGQRITKVVNTLRYVEERVLKMIEIWGGLDAFSDVATKPMPNPAGKDDMLHGPGDNEADEDRASQDDIDALFG